MLSNWDNTSAGSWCSAAMFTLSEWPVSLESYCRIPSWNAKQFDPLGMMSDLQTISGQRKNGWSMVHIIASFMFRLFRYKSLLCLITLMYRFNHHYGGTDVYKFTFDIRVDVWFLDELSPLRHPLQKWCTFPASAEKRNPHKCCPRHRWVYNGRATGKGYV